VKSIILVGGQGTRLRPLTYETPKQLLPLLGTPMIEQVVAHMASHGVTEVVLSMGYLPDRFVETYPSGSVGGVALTYVVEPAPLDTAGAIRYAAATAGIDETFIVVNGDVLTDVDLSSLVDFHHAKGAVGTIALTRVDDPSRFGVVVTDDNGQVQAFVEKPPRELAPTNEINAGIYVFEPSVLDRIASEGRVSVERDTFPALAAEGLLFARASDEYWLDTGTPQTFIQANVDALAKGTTAGVSHGTWVHPDATVDASARLMNSVVDRGCVIGPNVVLDQVVVMPDAQIDEGVEIHRAIIAPRSVVTRTHVIESDSIFDSAIG